MDQTEIARLEDAGRAAMAWIPDSPERSRGLSLLLAAGLPAFGIIAVAATVLLAVL